MGTVCWVRKPMSGASRISIRRKLTSVSFTNEMGHMVPSELDELVCDHSVRRVKGKLRDGESPMSRTIVSIWLRFCFIVTYRSFPAMIKNESSASSIRAEEHENRLGIFCHDKSVERHVRSLDIISVKLESIQSMYRSIRYSCCF